MPSANIQTCAKAMRLQYQRDAMFIADWLAERAQKNGDVEEYANWRRVVMAVQELERTGK